MKRPKKTGEKPVSGAKSLQPEKIEIVSLGSLAPIRLGPWGISNITKQAAKMLSARVAQKRTKVLEAEDTAANALQFILEAAEAGNRQAAKVAHWIAERLTLKINKLAARDTELWNPILANAIGWPIVASEEPDERAKNEALLARVGARAMIRVFPEKGTKSIRVQHTTMNGLLKLMGGGLNVLDVAVKHLSSGNPDDNEFFARADALCATLPKGIQKGGIRATLADLRKRGDFGRPTRKQLAAMIFAWLDAESSGRIEDIDFLRKRGINSQSISVAYSVEFDMMIRRIAKEQQILDDDYDEFIKSFLLTHRGPKTVEKAIRAQILRAISDSLNWYVSSR